MKSNDGPDHEFDELIARMMGQPEQEKDREDDKAEGEAIQQEEDQPAPLHLYNSVRAASKQLSDVSASRVNSFLGYPFPPPLADRSKEHHRHRDHPMPRREHEELPPRDERREMFERMRKTLREAKADSRDTMTALRDFFDHSAFTDDPKPFLNALQEKRESGSRESGREGPDMDINSEKS